ncbi:MAG: DNA-protecting protein DprA [Chloroflexi bacterium]|nr:DNA-protecting protein DprA [Chloroflexota bacterium]
MGHRNTPFWLGFSLIKGIGPSRLRGIYRHFHGDLEAAWQASPQALEHAGLSGTALENLLERRTKLNLSGSLERLADLGARICTLEDPDYPRLLAEIHDAPPIFYIKGELLPADERALAIVGTRRPTAYGAGVAGDLASALARADITIVSGLAIGIDVAAHRAALEAGGRTIAVMGNGIDQIYPPQNARLADDIVRNRQGAILTEYPPRTPPDAKHFPARNRIISGLSLGVLVVEAPEQSGALLKANLAAEQGREVFAVPGNITVRNSYGTNRLIQDGAKLVLRSDDVLEELNLSHRIVQTRQEVQSLSPADEIEAQLLQIIELEPLHIDEIAIRSQLSIQEVSARLTMMALKGMVQETAPMHYGLHRSAL